MFFMTGCLILVKRSIFFFAYLVEREGSLLEFLFDYSSSSKLITSSISKDCCWGFSSTYDLGFLPRFFLSLFYFDGFGLSEYESLSDFYSSMGFSSSSEAETIASLFTLVCDTFFSLAGVFDRLSFAEPLLLDLLDFIFYRGESKWLDEGSS